MRKATAVKLTPKDSCDKINVDGEVVLSFPPTLTRSHNHYAVLCL